MNYLLSGTQTKRLLFREIQWTDFDAWLEFHQDPRTSIHWVWDKKDPETECKLWYEKQFNRYAHDKGGMNALIEKDTGKLVGHCGLLVQTVDDQTELEIGYSLLPAFWNKGYAAEAATHCRDYAFQQELSESLISIISLSNTPSQRVAIKNGMYVDKQTTYAGNAVKIFRITKADWEARGL